MTKRIKTYPEPYPKPELIRKDQQIEKLRNWIEEQGTYNDICTYEILGEVCEDCQCERGRE